MLLQKYHLYLFFDYRLNGCVTPVGYGLVVGKVHKLSDFASLEKGDSIDKVIAVDDVASLYKEYLLDYVHFNTDRAKEVAHTSAKKTVQDGRSGA